MAQTRSDSETLFHVLEGESCGYCEKGTLERGTYKGNDAVVCDSCGTPGAQSW